MAQIRRMPLIALAHYLQYNVKSSISILPFEGFVSFAQFVISLSVLLPLLVCLAALRKDGFSFRVHGAFRVPYSHSSAL